MITGLSVVSLCCLWLTPLIAAEEVAEQAAAPVPTLTATEQASADALFAKYGKNALPYCRMSVDKNYTESQTCKTVEHLISKGADVNAKNNKGGTPLHDAAKDNKNKAIFDFLVSKGADADAKDNSGLTPNALLPRSRPTVPVYFSRRSGRCRSSSSTIPVMPAKCQPSSVSLRPFLRTRRTIPFSSHRVQSTERISS